MSSALSNVKVLVPFGLLLASVWTLVACVPRDSLSKRIQAEGSDMAKRDSIGEARMLPDGTITLLLRAEGPGGVVGQALLTYDQAHPRYEYVLRHLAPMKPGDVKPVPPFPSDGER